MLLRQWKTDLTIFLKSYREEFIKAGKELDGEKIPQLTEELFSEYERTGNRLEYEVLRGMLGIACSRQQK